MNALRINASDRVAFSQNLIKIEKKGMRENVEPIVFELDGANAPFCEAPLKASDDLGTQCPFQH